MTDWITTSLTLMGVMTGIAGGLLLAGSALFGAAWFAWEQVKKVYGMAVVMQSIRMRSSFTEAANRAAMIDGLMNVGQQQHRDYEIAQLTEWLERVTDDGECGEPWKRQFKRILAVLYRVHREPAALRREVKP